ncbi:hypothetical protein [Syntrophotalea acetylenica]|uniref:Uncharacterized protein n=1 Tax=Syntrophotalea acetylenica TaxID=29542 RepID=A0A1L3GJU3_SYNAC|nr:hypothetical protein [Syntrophotalea acetylenica]APG26160.1 hypothetical protein A7E75_03755 [Syntrophotalea acetylenica]
MNITLLKQHIDSYKQELSKNPEQATEALVERKERCAYYQGWTRERILSMSEEDFLQYMAKLWAMLIWGNKKYVVDKMILDNGFDALRKELADLVWGDAPLSKRWDTFKKSVKGFGPAMMSEILCHAHPDQCMLWNRRAYVGFDYLGIKDLPRYNYQMAGKKYVELSEQAKKIADILKDSGMPEVNLLTVDYLIWDELQVVDNLSKIHEKAATQKSEPPPAIVDKETSTFIHNEIRDKLATIGEWLGFKSKTEIKVADGSHVDTIWEATIGNMGRVIYVFEVQTKGSIDSLIVNLLKALNNPAVQGVVAVSDSTQLEKIRKHAKEVPNLGAKLKCWDYEKVLETHDALEMVNETINSLGLVPQGF